MKYAYTITNIKTKEIVYNGLQQDELFHERENADTVAKTTLRVLKCIHTEGEYVMDIIEIGEAILIDSFACLINEEKEPI